MYVSSNPTRPIASWTVATPYFASAATRGGIRARHLLHRYSGLSDHGTLLLAGVRIGKSAGYEHFAAHDEPRRAQQRGVQNFAWDSPHSW